MNSITRIFPVWTNLQISVVRTLLSRWLSPWSDLLTAMQISFRVELLLGRKSNSSTQKVIWRDPQQRKLLQLFVIYFNRKQYSERLCYSLGPGVWLRQQWISVVQNPVRLMLFPLVIRLWGGACLPSVVVRTPAGTIHRYVDSWLLTGCQVFILCAKKKKKSFEIQN